MKKLKYKEISELKAKEKEADEMIDILCKALNEIIIYKANLKSSINKGGNENV